MLGGKINCWGQVVSPILFSFDAVMQGYKRPLNIITLIGIMFIIVGIKMDQIVYYRHTQKEKTGQALEKKRSNGDQIDFG